MAEIERNELTAEEIKVKGDYLWSKVKLDFQSSSVAYVSRDDIKFAVGHTRETSTVRSKFEKKVLAELNSVVADVGGGRLAIVKK